MAENFQNSGITQTFTIVQAGSRFSHYKVLSKIGAGGMGDVFLAEDAILNRNIVLKFLPPHLAADESFKSRFLREAKTAASLNHPNIITIFEINESDGQVYIAMEQVKGQSLKEHLSVKHEDYNLALDIIIQVCSGLEAAHDIGIIHRDIKPDNIMITRSGLVKVLDFGLAKFKDDGELTKAGTTLGTVNYMSPEQAQGLELDQRSDIFSVGIVLYELLTNEPAFAKDSMHATIYSIINDELPLLIEKRSDIQDEVQQVINKCLNKDKSLRYQSMSEMIEDIKSIRGQSIVFSTYKTSAPPVESSTMSLAVLNLNNLGSVDDEYLCYGITEDLIVDLTRIGSLRVAPMRSVLKYKDSDLDIKVIAKQLDVEFLLDGSMMKMGETVRVSVQLINVSTGKNVWAERWETSANQLHKIKENLNHGIVDSLNLKEEIKNETQSKVVKQVNAVAYELYLRGKYTFDHKKTITDVDVAVGLYNQALSSDENLFIARIGIAEVLVHKGDYEKAIQKLLPTLEEAIKEKRDIDAFKIYIVIGNAKIHLSIWDEAIESLTHATDLAVKLGDLTGEANALQLLIDVYQQRAEFDKALRLFERVMQITRELDDQDLAAESLKSIANVHFRKGEYDRAMILYNEAIVIAKRRINIQLEAKCVCNIGLAQGITGNTKASIENFLIALDMYTRVGDRKGQSNAYNNLALVYSSHGDYEDALECGQKAVDLERDLKETAGYALTICNVARYKAILGFYEDAICLANEALQISLDLDYPFVRNLANDSLGYCYYCSNNLPKALKYYKTALEVSQISGLRREEGLAMSHIAESLFYLNDEERSLEFAKKAIELGNDVGGTIAIIRASIYHALLAFDDEQSETAIVAGEETLQKARDYEDPRLIITCLRLLHEIYKRSSDDNVQNQKGVEYLSEALKLAEDKKIIHEIRMCKSAMN